MSSEPLEQLRIDELGPKIRIKVRIAPKSKRDAIIGVHDGALKIAVTAPPVDGKANAALIQVLAKKLKIARSKITIRAGAVTRNKTLEIEIGSAQFRACIVETV